MVLKFVSWREYADVDEALDGVDALSDEFADEVDRALSASPSGNAVYVKYGVQVEVADTTELTEADLDVVDPEIGGTNVEEYEWSG